MLRLQIVALLLCGCLPEYPYQQPVTPATPPENPWAVARDKQTTPAENPARPIAPVSSVVLRDGQEVVLRNADPIASNKSQSGEVVQFEVIRDVTSDGVVVIPEHAIAVGKILTAEHAKLVHHGGRLSVAIESVQLANGDYARLRAVESRNERNFGWRDVGAATAIAATLYYMPLAPVYLLAKGDEVDIPPGSRFTAYVDGDVTLDRAGLETAASMPEVNRDVATFFIYRGNQDKAPGVALPVSCGKLYLGELTDSTYVKLDVPAGRYWFYTSVPATKLSASQQKTQMIALNLVAREKYYLEVAYVSGSWKTLTSTIRQADESAGAEEVFKAQSRGSALLPAKGTREFAQLSAKPKGVKD